MLSVLRSWLEDLVVMRSQVSRVGSNVAATLTAVLLFGIGCQAETPKGDVKLQNASFDQLEKAIAAHKGKVVVLDVWGEF